MIARLTGTLVHHEPNRGILDVHGVGYEIFATHHALAAWEGKDQVTIHISTQVREDAITLFAFPRPLERTAFQILLGVSGVGPKMALAALEALALEELYRAVESDDVVVLSRIPGVGKKKAQRLALELKGKLPIDLEVEGPQPRGAAGPADDLPLALAQLDYGKSEIDRALAGLEEQGIAVDAPLQERLAAALRVLAGRRR
ncbi:MAG TPA: Holliday junction branch migration protein RuvA [Deltaproteobacteria bacterium]|nr:Holliday junction branch migration protein RuvA [Deltaproteobacteria bacterium]